MTDDREPLVIDAVGIVSIIAALVDHLASLGVTDRKAFAAHLRSVPMSVAPDLVPQMRLMADALDKRGPAPLTLIDGGKPN